MSSEEIVAKLWGLCHLLRDEGITYPEYLNELSYLLFLKMMEETRQEEMHLPKTSRWSVLVSKSGTAQLALYRGFLNRLGNTGKTPQVRAIFKDAKTAFVNATNLASMVASIGKIDWHHADAEALGDMYEGLLERIAGEKKSGAGQYFTPRPLIDSIVQCIKPRNGEVLQDPAAGTGGFLLSASRYVRAYTNQGKKRKAPLKISALKPTFQAVELVQDTHRLLSMNCLLHGIEGDFHLGDALGERAEDLMKADVILSNPPFGTKGGGRRPERSDLPYSTGNKQLSFLMHIYGGLKPGGRASVVLPDNVLFEEGVGTKIRYDLMNKCNLHTILRLPTGIFYAQGVKTNVLFFTRGTTDTCNTQKIWVYDLRTNMPAFGKRTPLTRNHFKDFEAAYGDQPDGSSHRKDQGEAGRFRSFTREQINERGDNLDVKWFKDADASGEDGLLEPDEIAALIRKKLSSALGEIDAITALLDEKEVGA